MDHNDSEDEIVDAFMQDFKHGSMLRSYFMLTETFAACLEEARPTFGGGHYKIPKKQFELMVQQIQNARESIAGFEGSD